MIVIQPWRIPPHTTEEIWAWKLYVAAYEDIKSKSPVFIILEWVKQFTCEDEDVVRAINIWILRSDPRTLCII